jgi:hypothetical protein
MSRSAEIELTFGDEPRLFRLRIGQWRVLQEKMDGGPAWLMERLGAGDCFPHELRLILQQGLIGGGMESAAASRLLDLHFEGLPFAQFHAPALAIVHASYVGVEDEPFPQSAAGEETSTSPAAS